MATQALIIQVHGAHTHKSVTSAISQSHALKHRETAIHFSLERVSVIQSSLLLKIKKLNNFKYINIITQQEETYLAISASESCEESCV